MEKKIGFKNMFCPICGQIHDIDKYEDITTITIKSERISVKQKYYVCDEQAFCLPSQMNKTFKRAKKVYNSRVCVKKI